jgi:competence ComEA-like helix-hairpin-helix protein
LLNIADDVTTDSSQQRPGLVNINTASWEVLACLPGLDRELARAIVSYRDSNGFFPNVACLLKVSGLTRAIFKQVAPRVATRSETFRLLSEGQVTSSHIRQRMEVVVHVGRNRIDTLAYREDDL